MIGSLTPRLERLPRSQRRLWPQLQPSVALGWVLYGGTAVSLHLGHRASVDFDFFSERALDEARLRRAFPFMRSARVLQQTPDTLVAIAAAVKVSFFGAIDCGRVRDPLLSIDGVAEVAAREDLLAHKLKVILQRAERKDYDDIVALLRAGLSLEYGLAAAHALFGPAFQPAECLRALTWFRDGDVRSLSAADRRTLTDAAVAINDLPRVRLKSRSLSLPV